MLKFIVRVDDYPRALNTDPRLPDATKHLRLAMFNEVFKKYGVKYILGVVPTMLDSRDIQIIQEAKIDVAMHGVDHRRWLVNLCECNVKEIRVIEEMEGESCRLHKLLAEHKRIMEVRFGKITSYISPFDEDTPNLRYHLKQIGFKTFFGGKIEEGGKCFFDDNGLMCLQSSHLYYTRSREIPALVFNEQIYRDEYALNMIEEDTLITITLHFTWETIESAYVSNLSRLCDMLAKHVTVGTKELEEYCK
ncbi:MAG: hypothetical protein V1709_00895 [Planctomycetota bacterium]